MRIFRFFCWHSWKPAKYQFQALVGPPSLTLKCEKCGKIKMTDLPPKAGKEG